ncbi:hypothetical protein [Heyndrickxia ginsengihumi]|uniref:hypothetical protein n=1 Tax=Heyndrickxia ginsengihumi TaxID=363870 RepID=UPI003D1D0311
MYKTDFLKRDLPDAIRHYECCSTCLEKAFIAFCDDDLETAEKRMEEFQRSMNELKRLLDKKRKHDEIEQIVSRLAEKGIKVESIFKWSAM